MGAVVMGNDICEFVKRSELLPRDIGLMTQSRPLLGDQCCYSQTLDDCIPCGSDSDLCSKEASPTQRVTIHGK